MSWNKPLPQATTISAPYWDGLKSHEVRLQQCEHGHWLFFPRTHCPTCGSRQLAWQTVSGEGTLYSFTVARVPTLPEFNDEMPQLLAVVEQDQGVHINTTLVGVDAAAVRIGQRLRPVFDERPGSVTLLRYTSLESDHPPVIAAEAAPAAEPVAQAPAEPAKRQVSCKDLEAMGALTSCRAIRPEKCSRPRSSASTRQADFPCLYRRGSIFFRSRGFFDRGIVDMAVGEAFWPRVLT
jgi:uncharacterized OB-fold protein